MIIIYNICIVKTKSIRVKNLNNMTGQFCIYGQVKHAIIHRKYEYTRHATTLKFISVMKYKLANQLCRHLQMLLQICAQNV